MLKSVKWGLYNYITILMFLCVKIYSFQIYTVQFYIFIQNLYTFIYIFIFKYILHYI